MKVVPVNVSGRVESEKIKNVVGKWKNVVSLHSLKL